MNAAQAVEPPTNRAKRFDPAQVGWRIGAGHPEGVKPVETRVVMRSV